MRICWGILCLVNWLLIFGCGGLPSKPWNYRDVQFVNPKIGWLRGPVGSLLKTVDGGQTWSVLDTRDGFTYFVDSLYGWRTLHLGVERTTDGGLTWQQSLQLKDPRQQFYSLHFVDRLSGWIVGRGPIWHTSDGGATWEEQAKEIEFPDLNDIYFANSGCGWSVGYYGTILRTCDGGRIWEKINVGEQYHLKAIQFVKETEGWVVGNDAIFHSSDGGKTWSIQEGLSSGAIDVHFINEKTGWVVGFDGLILHTSDSGGTWIRQESGTKMHLMSVWFVDENTGWAVGGWDQGDRYQDEAGKPREGWFEGIILHTVNGGQTWERVEPPIKRRRWF